MNKYRPLNDDKSLWQKTRVDRSPIYFSDQELGLLFTFITNEALDGEHDKFDNELRKKNIEKYGKSNEEAIKNVLRKIVKEMRRREL